MINQIPPELFAERPIRSNFGQRRGGRFNIKYLAIGAVVIVLALTGGIYLQFFSGDGEQPAEIPTISAEAPLKQRPDQPGGIDIPHQDVTVFQQVENNGEAKPEVKEHLLPPSEMPKTVDENISDQGRSVVMPNTVVENEAPLPLMAPTVNLATQRKPEQIAVPPANTPPAPPAIIPSPQVEKLSDAPSVAEVKKLVETVPAKQPEVKNPEVAPKSMIVGQLPKELFTGQPIKNYWVQLASFPDQSVAQAQMKKMQEKHSGALDGVKLHLTKADIPNKGTYYRVQGGPVTSTHAKNICALLLEQKVSCIIVKQ